MGYCWWSFCRLFLLRELINDWSDIMCSYKTREGTKHDPKEKERIPYLFFQPTGPHAGKHHTQCHETGAERIVGSLVFALTELHHKKSEGGKPKTIAQLFDGHTAGNKQGVGRGGKGEE